MSDDGAATAALLMLLAKTLKPLSAEQLCQLAAGEAKLVVLLPGYQVTAVGGTAGARTSQPGKATPTAVDLDTLASSIQGMQSADDVIAHLNGSRKFTVDVLKDLAGRLSIVIPSSTRRKPEIQREIADSVVGSGARSVAIREGSWR